MEGEQPYLDRDDTEDEPLTGPAAASLRYRIGLGPLTGERTMTLRLPGAEQALEPNPTPLTANHDGFSLSAVVACRAGERNWTSAMSTRPGKSNRSSEKNTLSGSLSIQPGDVAIPRLLAYRYLKPGCSVRWCTFNQNS